MNISKPNNEMRTLKGLLLTTAAMAIVAGIATGFPLGRVAGKNYANEEWRQRMQQAGFNLVTRYDQITGQPRLVLIPVNKSEIK